MQSPKFYADVDDYFAWWITSMKSLGTLTPVIRGQIRAMSMHLKWMHQRSVENEDIKYNIFETLYCFDELSYRVREVMERLAIHYSPYPYRHYLSLDL